MKASQNEKDPRDPRKFPQDSINVIKLAVAEEFSVNVSAFYQKGRGRDPIGQARQIAMYFCYEFGLGSTSSVGQRFDRDHTTVIKACRSVRDLIRCPTIDLRLHQRFMRCKERIETFKRFAPIDLTKPASKPDPDKGQLRTGDRPLAPIIAFPIAG